MKKMEMQEFWELIKAPIRREILHEHFQVCEDWTGKFNGLNSSSTFSFLIKEAGRLCDQFASDMYVDLSALDTAINGSDSVLFTQDKYQWVVGIRDYGCDHDTFIKCRIEDASDLERVYRKMYYLEIEKDYDYEDSRWFNLYLYEINIWELNSAARKAREMA